MILKKLKNKFLLLFISLFLISSDVFGQSQETINKCAKDIESTSPEIRQQAAMILGKYEEQIATDLLLKHLNDESNLVRRAVLVSLQDRLQKRMVSLANMALILDLLEDKDVEVRRLASSSAQFFIGIFLRGNINNPSQRPNPQNNQNEQKVIKTKFINSIQDSDDIVRLNNLTTITQNRQLIFDPDFKDAILARVNDTNKAVIILTLELLYQINNIDIKGIANKLVNHEQADVLLALIKFLEVKAHTDPEIWAKLSSKPNLDVSSKAIETGFRLQVKDMETKYSAFLLDETNPVKQRSDMILQLPLHPKKKELLTSLLEDKSNTIRLAVIKISQQILEQAEFKILLKKHIDDSSAAIKEEVSAQLLEATTFSDLDILKLLFVSEKEALRLSVLEKIDELKMNGDDIIFEALLDDSKNIRLKAFALCGQNKSKNPQIKTMLLKSIEETDSEIRAAALKAVMLYATEAEMLTIYSKMIENSENIVKAQIAISLRKYPRSEAHPLLVTLSEDKSIQVATEAHLSLYLLGERKSLTVLAKNITSNELPLTDKLNLQMIISKEKAEVSQAFGVLLNNENPKIRLNSIKFFSQNRDLYLEEYFDAIFKESDQTVIQITSEIYLSKKFKNLEINKKLLTSLNIRLKQLGLRILLENYDESLLPLIKELLQAKDLMTIYMSLEIVKKNKIDSVDTIIIDFLKSKSDDQIKTPLFHALLVLNTENANNYLKTIDDASLLKPYLTNAQRIKGVEDTHPTKPGGKTR